MLVVIVLGQVLPAAWYGAFSDPWMDANNLTMDIVEEEASATPYIFSIISSAIFAYVLAWLFTRLRVESAMQGLTYGLAMGFAFTVLPFAVNNTFSLRPASLIWIDGGVNLLIWAAAGLVLGAWRKYAT